MISAIPTIRRKRLVRPLLLFVHQPNRAFQLCKHLFQLLVYEKTWLYYLWLIFSCCRLEPAVFLMKGGAG